MIRVFTVSGAQKPQARPRVRKWARAYTPANKWRDAIVWLAKEHFKDDWPKDQRYQVAIELIGCSKRGDVDNYGKAAVDALQAAGAFKNDNQVDTLLITRGGRKPARTTILVSVLS